MTLPPAMSCVRVADQMRLVKQRLNELVPNLKVFLVRPWLSAATHLPTCCSHAIDTTPSESLSCPPTCYCGRMSMT